MSLILDFNGYKEAACAKNRHAVVDKVVIIIPTYNEAAVIKNTVTQIFKEVEAIANFDIHVLIFDSASTDNTENLVIELQTIYPKLHLKNEPKKTGLGSAYLQAMQYALTTLNADIVFEFDADLSHQPKYIAPILEKIKQCDVVVGSRYIRGGSIPKDWGWHRKLFSVFGNYIARAVLTPKYKDFTSGFRATRRSYLSKILPSKFLSNHYPYKLQLLWLLHKSGANISEYPIEFLDREQGESKLPSNSVCDSLRVIFTLRFYEIKRYLKMCLVGVLGLIVQFTIYNILRQHLIPFHASQIAVGAAILNNFILNSKYTFKNHLKKNPLFSSKRLIGFSLYSIVMIYAQSWWLQLGVDYFGTGLLPENLILISGLGLASLMNYFTYSRHIWPEPKKRF